MNKDFIVRVISIDYVDALTYFLKAGTELRERNDRIVIPTVAFTSYFGVEDTSFLQSHPQSVKSRFQIKYSGV
ncbi:MAG: hypothetical protein JW779_13120 [Candidatus Thorarchaeota archaeon]|nr:hypothetical protein [Candidatus Thorarchaeota archaeon]